MSDELPPGFTLDEPAAGAGDLPPGFALDPPQAPGPAPSRLGRFAMGAGDIIAGGAQFLANSLPEGVVSGVNSATQYVNELPVIGPATRALGMTPATPQRVNELAKTREDSYQAARQAGGDTGIDWMRMGGQGAMGVIAGRALPVAATLPGSIAAGAVGGAGAAALEPVAEGEYWQGKRNQLAGGAGLGAALGPVGHVIGRAIAPRINPNVRTLADAGVDNMTPGQILGGGLRRLEDASTSLPVVGDVVRNAQRGSLESFNRASANQALGPIGEAVDAATPVGREMVQETGDRISAAYQRAYAQAQPFGPDAQFATDIQQLGQRFLTPTSRNTFAAAMQNDVISRIQAAGGRIDADTFQAIKQELGNRARQYGRSQEPDNQELADAFGGVLRAMHGLMARSNPQTAPLLRQADEAFARNVRVEGAAGRVAATDGIFTAPQLAGAVRAADGSVRHNQYARGNALMQDLSDAGRAVLPSTVPDSGTPFRGLANVGTLGAAGAGAATGFIPGAALIGGAGIMAAYTNPARRAIQAALLANRSAGVTAAGDAVAGAGGVAGGIFANEWARPNRNRLAD